MRSLILVGCLILGFQSSTLVFASDEPSCPNFPNRLAVHEADFRAVCAKRPDGFDVALSEDINEAASCEPRTCNRASSLTVTAPAPCPNYPNRVAILKKDFDTYCASKEEGTDVAVSEDLRSPSACEPRTWNKANSYNTPPHIFPPAASR